MMALHVMTTCGERKGLPTDLYGVVEMRPVVTLSTRNLVLSGALGAVIGALSVGLALSLDIMGIATMLGQTD